MPDVSFGDLVAVCAIGFLIPLALGFFPGLRLPAAALQIVAGIVVEAIGFGFLVPVFFVASGLRFDLGAHTHDVSALAKVPALVAALLIVRGLPAFLYRRDIGTRRAVAAGLLQATSLAFIVATAQIGTELGLLDTATAAALVAAGLVSVVVFPGAALAVLAVDSRDATSLPSTP